MTKKTSKILATILSSLTLSCPFCHGAAAQRPSFCKLKKALGYSLALGVGVFGSAAVTYACLKTKEKSKEAQAAKRYEELRKEYFGEALERYYNRGYDKKGNENLTPHTIAGMVSRFVGKLQNESKVSPALLEVTEAFLDHVTSYMIEYLIFNNETYDFIKGGKHKGIRFEKGIFKLDLKDTENDFEIKNGMKTSKIVRRLAQTICQRCDLIKSLCSEENKEKADYVKLQIKIFLGSEIICTFDK